MASIIRVKTALSIPFPAVANPQTPHTKMPPVLMYCGPTIHDPSLSFNAGYPRKVTESLPMRMRQILHMPSYRSKRARGYLVDLEDFVIGEVQGGGFMGVQRTEERIINGTEGFSVPFL